MKHSEYFFEQFWKKRRVILTILFALVIGIFCLLPTYIPFEEPVHCQSLYEAARDDCVSSSLDGSDEAASGNRAEEIAVEPSPLPDCSLHGITGGVEDCPAPTPTPPPMPPYGGPYNEEP